MTRKRSLSLVLALACVFALFCGTASATENRASPILSSYLAAAHEGEKTGEINISFIVRSSKLADSVGAEKIEIYKSNGVRVATITGTTDNDMIITNDMVHQHTYTYNGTSGTTYYAVVTVFAERGTVYDSRTITTPTVTAP